MLSTNPQARKFVWLDGDLEIVEQPGIKEALTLVEKKVHVNAHNRRTKTGRVSAVKAYEREVDDNFHSRNPHSWAPGSTPESRAKGFDSLPPNAKVWVFHGADEETANDALANGLKLVNKKKRAVDVKGFGPGKGLSDKTYVASDPMNAAGYGKRILAIRVRKQDIDKSPEQTWGSHSTVGKALALSDAILIRDVHRGNIIDVTQFKSLPAVDVFRKRSLKEALLERTTRVRAHQRRSKKGKIEQVKEHERQLLHEKFAVKSVIPISQRVWNGHPVEFVNKLSKQQYGALGENIVVAYLQRRWKGARLLNEGDPDAPFDVGYKNLQIEVKTSLASNDYDSMKWSLNFGQRKSKKDKAILRRGSSEDIKDFYKRLEKAIFKRKADAAAEVKAKYGSVKVRSYGLIINTKNQTADIYSYHGIHKQMRWVNPKVKVKHKATVRYTLA